LLGTRSSPRILSCRSDFLNLGVELTPPELVIYLTEIFSYYGQTRFRYQP